MKKIFLYLSAFVPLYFLIVIKLLIDIINDNLHFNILNTLVLVINLTFAVLGIIGLVWNIKYSTKNTESIIIVKKKSITAQHFLGYFSLFVLFALTFELEKISMFVVYLIILILIGIVYIKNDLFYINPFLNILGYNFYDITYYLKDDNSKTLKQAKFFYKGNLKIDNTVHSAKLSHQNFSFIIRNKK